MDSTEDNPIFIGCTRETVWKIWSFVQEKRTPLIGKLTLDLIYDRLAPGVRQRLEEVNPKNEKGYRRPKLFQRLTDDVGDPYRFEVTGRSIVEPTDLSALRQSPSPQLTLITCYPTHYVGPATKRPVVVARLIATLNTAGE
jgi:hypothetical protein